MLNITLDLDTGLAKLAVATTIKAGAQVPVTINTVRGATPTSPGASPAFELGLGTDATPPVLKAYLDIFTAENDHTFTGVLDANDTRLVTFMSGKGTVNFGGEVAWTVAGQLEVAPSFPVPVQSRVIPSDPTSEGGPDYYTETEVDALLAAGAKVALVAATGNLTLSGPQTIDGVAVIAGDVVFAKSQTTAADRKRYTVGASAWTALDQPAAVLVQKGTVNSGRVFVLSAVNTYSERLSNVDNTSDANKPVSTAQQTALNAKAASGANSDITSLSNVTTLGASGGVINVPGTTSANSTLTGSLTIGNGTAATNVAIGGGKIWLGGSLKWATAGGGDIGGSSDNYPNCIYCSQVIGGYIYGSQSLHTSASGQFYWDNRSVFSSPADGVITLSNYAQNGFTGMLFGPSGTAYGRLKVTGSGGNGQWRLADDSADAPWSASNLTASGTLAVAGATTLGPGGTPIAGSKVFTSYLSGLISVGAVSSQAITATGVAAGDTCSAPIFDSVQPAGLVLAGVRTDTDVIYVDFYNADPSTAHSLTGTVTVRSLKA